MEQEDIQLLHHILDSETKIVAYLDTLEKTRELALTKTKLEEAVFWLTYYLDELEEESSEE